MIQDELKDLEFPFFFKDKSNNEEYKGTGIVYQVIDVEEIKNILKPMILYTFSKNKTLKPLNIQFVIDVDTFNKLMEEI